jgi:O-antigen/teichoic acid export membrane protein
MVTPRRTYVRNLISLFLWQGGNYLAPLVTLPYLARVLGPHTMGQIALAVSVTAYFLLVTNWGFNLSASRLVAQNVEDRERLRETFWGTFTAKAFNGILSLVVITVLTLAIPDLRAIAPLVFFAALAIVANVLTLNWALQGLERLDMFAGASLTGKLLTIPLVFLLVHSPADAWLSVLIQTGTSLASGIFSIVLVRRLGRIGRPLVSAHHALEALRHGWHVFLSTIATSVYTTSNVVILSFFAPPAQVGIFSGADRLRAAAQAVMNPVADASYPRVARMMREDTGEAYGFVRRLIVVQTLLCLGIALVLCFGAPLIVAIVLGPEYEGAVAILQVLAWVPFVVGISNVFGYQVLLQSGRHDLFSRIIWLSLPIHLVTVFPLAWWLGGVGIALATLLTESVIMMALVATSISVAPHLLGRPASSAQTR